MIFIPLLNKRNTLTKDTTISDLNYKMVGWNKVCELIDSLDRNVTMSDYINTTWENWQNNFLLIIYNYNGIDAFQD